jgi:hypothetical protein
LADEENKAIDILEKLYDSVDAIPLALLTTTEELRNAGPELFEKSVVHGVQVVRFGFSRPAPQNLSRC